MMSWIFIFSPKSFSFCKILSTAELLRTRSVFLSGLIMSLVSNSLASIIASFTFWWTGASLVAIKRVPIFIPSAPNARAATNCCPLPIPPDATKGIFNSAAARGSKIILGMSSSPGWPPHSNPSTLAASHPIFSAFRECRTEVHLCITLMPAPLSFSIYFSGLLPAVSTILTPPSITASI